MQSFVASKPLDAVIARLLDRGDACAADTAGACPAVRAVRDDGAGGGTVLGGADRDREPCHAQPAETAGPGVRLPALAAQPGGRRRMPPCEAQRRYALVRMRFNSILTQFDVFADVITQRSERDNGVWLAGLDDVAADALALPGGYYMPPPVVCYLERGHGAAIRRARTRLPGGGVVDVAIVQVPRERMVGSGIASSLVHEVGHQASVLLDLAPSLRPVLRGLQSGGGEAIAWQYWERWISEILADLWSVAKVGVAGTMGLMGVVSLPRPFVFRIDLDDPHPAPWIRVKLSAALGEALYPDAQWGSLAAIWDTLYPKAGLSEDRCRLLTILERSMPGVGGGDNEPSTQTAARQVAPRGAGRSRTAAAALAGVF